MNSWLTFPLDVPIDRLYKSMISSVCVDQNQNKSCDADEPSAGLTLTFSRIASFDTWTDRLIECAAPTKS